MHVIIERMKRLSVPCPASVFLSTLLANTSIPSFLGLRRALSDDSQTTPMPWTRRKISTEYLLCSSPIACHRLSPSMSSILPLRIGECLLLSDKLLKQILLDSSARGSGP